VVLDGSHGFRGDHGVDHGFFDGLYRRCKNRIEIVIRQHFAGHWFFPFSACGFAVENAMKMSPQPFPEMLPSRPRPNETRRHVGEATSIMWSPALKKMIALASVGRERAAAGTLLQMQMTVEAVRHTVAAKVVPLPFFNPLRKTATPLV
jgi:glycine cleavage system aminomethyltransferase T